MDLKLSGISVGLDLAIIVVIVSFVIARIQDKKDAKQKEKNQNAQTIAQGLQLLISNIVRHKKADSNSEEDDLIRGETLCVMKEELIRLRLNIVTFGTPELYRDTHPYFSSFEGALSGNGYSNSEDHHKYGAKHALFSVAALLDQALKTAQEADVVNKYIKNIFNLTLVDINNELSKFPKLLETNR